MSKAVTQPLQLTNPWDVRAPGAQLPTVKAPPAQGDAGAVDHYGTEKLPSALHQRLSRTLNHKELMRAFSARVLDTHDRCAIFRHRLADQFSGAANVAWGFDLADKHDYNKVLEFMDTGHWPRGTPAELVALFPRLLDALLRPLEGAYADFARNEASDACRHSGGDPAKEGVDAQAHKGAESVCDAIRLAHLQGQSSLRLQGQPALLSLPQHLASLQQLKHLSLTDLGVHTLPALAKLKHLESLTLSGLAGLKSFGDSLHDVASLKTLKLSGVPLHTAPLPQALADLAQLQTVDVGDVKLARPAWLPPHVRFVGPSA